MEVQEIKKCVVNYLSKRQSKVPTIEDVIEAIQDNYRIYPKEGE